MLAEIVSRNGLWRGFLTSSANQRLFPLCDDACDDDLLADVHGHDGDEIFVAWTSLTNTDYAVDLNLPKNAKCFGLVRIEELRRQR